MSSLYRISDELMSKSPLCVKIGHPIALISTFFQVLSSTNIYYCAVIASRIPTAVKASATPQRMPVITL